MCCYTLLHVTRSKSKRRTVADDGSFDAVEGSKYGARCGQAGEKRVQTKSMLPIKSKEKGVEAREINVDSNDEGVSIFSFLY